MNLKHRLIHLWDHCGPLSKGAQFSVIASLGWARDYDRPTRVYGFRENKNISDLVLLVYWMDGTFEKKLGVMGGDIPLRPLHITFSYVFVVFEHMLHISYHNTKS